MWEQYAAGRNLGHWRRIHDRLNAPPPGKSPIPPSVIARAVSATRAAVGFVASGLKVVSPEDRQQRLAICRACDRYDAASGQCLACGCAVRIKAAMALQQCPLKKWAIKET
jgi:hypothetical protein